MNMIMTGASGLGTSMKERVAPVLASETVSSLPGSPTWPEAH